MLLIHCLCTWPVNNSKSKNYFCACNVYVAFLSLCDLYIIITMFNIFSKFFRNKSHTPIYPIVILCQLVFFIQNLISWYQKIFWGEKIILFNIIEKNNAIFISNIINWFIICTFFNISFSLFAQNYEVNLDVHILFWRKNYMNQMSKTLQKWSCKDGNEYFFSLKVEEGFCKNFQIALFLWVTLIPCREYLLEWPPWTLWPRQ